MTESEIDKAWQKVIKASNCLFLYCTTSIYEDDDRDDDRPDPLDMLKREIQ